MYRVIDKRGNGKTCRLMLLAKETGATIVCVNPLLHQRKAEEYGLVGLTFVSYKQFLNGQYDTSKPYLLDEIDLFVKTLDSHMLGFSLSTED